MTPAKDCPMLLVKSQSVIVRFDFPKVYIAPPSKENPLVKLLLEI
jgi:hypothetical protein